MAIIIKKGKAPPDTGVKLVVPPKVQPQKPLDGMYAAVRSRCSANASVSWFLMASYAYYVLNQSIVTDDCYDGMAKDILASWGTLTHQHRHLISLEDLKAGTLFALKASDYPMMTVYAVRRLLDLHNEDLPCEPVEKSPSGKPLRRVVKLSGPGTRKS